MDDGKHLLVMDLIVPLDQRKCFGKEGDRVPFFIFHRHMREDSTSGEVGAVGFDLEGFGGVWQGAVVMLYKGNCFCSHLH